jgi:hypothetical protein
MESYAGFALGSVNKTTHKQNQLLEQLKRTHSFHDFEKPHLREVCGGEHSLKYRMMKAHKDLFA